MPRQGFEAIDVSFSRVLGRGLELTGSEPAAWVYAANVALRGLLIERARSRRLRAELAKAHHAAAEACAKEMDRMESNLRLGAGPDGWASNEYTANAMRWEAVGYMRAAGLLRDGAWRKHMEAGDA